MHRNHFMSRCQSLLVAVIAVAVGSALVSATPAGAVQTLAEVDVTRYGGADRYATSLLVAEAVAADAGGNLDSVVMVSGRSWTDAVVAAPLAGAPGAPVLTTPPGTPARRRHRVPAAHRGTWAFSVAPRSWPAARYSLTHWWQAHSRHAAHTRCCSPRPTSCTQGWPATS